MFCIKCGQTLEEGKPFCINCGAPAQGGVTSPDVDATAIRTVTGGDTPPPAVFTPAAAPLPPPQGGLARYGAGGGWQPPQGQPLGAPYSPPQGPPPGGNRTGIIVGSIAAAIIVLAGAGVGLWLGLRDDGSKTDSTKVVSSTTTTVTTGGETTSSSGGAATTQTTSGLTTSTGPGPSGSTGTTVDLLTEWYIAHENLVMEMDYDNGRIPELADAINASAPNVPDWVYGELEDMADIMQRVSQTMTETPVPPGFDDAHYWIMQAATHMANRVQATMHGISVMWYTGSIDSATADFNTGRAERDAYLAAIEQHYFYMPAD